RRDLRAPAWDHGTHRPLLPASGDDQNIFRTLDHRYIELFITWGHVASQPTATLEVGHRAPCALGQVAPHVALGPTMLGDGLCVLPGNDDSNFSLPCTTRRAAH